MKKFQKTLIPAKGVTMVIVPDTRLCVKAVKALNAAEFIHSALDKHAKKLSGLDREVASELDTMAYLMENDVYDFIKMVINTLEDDEEENKKERIDHTHSKQGCAPLEDSHLPMA